MQIVAGTASVSLNGTTVTGSGTTWSSDVIVPGLSIFASGVNRARIARVVSATSIRLAEPWPGPTLSSGPYQIAIDFTPLGLPLIDETAVELPSLWNTAMERITAKLALLGAPLSSPLPLIDETTENLPELWNSMLDEVEARLADLGITA